MFPHGVIFKLLKSQHSFEPHFQLPWASSKVTSDFSFLFWSSDSPPRRILALQLAVQLLCTSNGHEAPVRCVLHSEFLPRSVGSPRGHWAVLNRGLWYWRGIKEYRNRLTLRQAESNRERQMDTHTEKYMQTHTHTQTAPTLWVKA